MEFVCNTGDIGPEDVLRVELADGHAVAVYRLDGDYFCSDDLCTHGEASLADGEIEDGSIICPFHLGAFCIRTGEPTAAPCTEAVQVHAVHRDGEALYITRS